MTCDTSAGLKNVVYVAAVVASLSDYHCSIGTLYGRRLAEVVAPPGQLAKAFSQ